MTEGGYKIRNQSATHFLTFTVVEWIDIFTRQVYRDIILDSFRHCQAERGLLVHCWCIMSNHLHFIATVRNNDLSEVVRDFKKFTSQKLIKSVRNNPLKAGRIGCCASLRNRVPGMGEIRTISSGYRITIPKNATVLALLFRK